MSSPTNHRQSSQLINELAAKIILLEQRISILEKSSRPTHNVVNKPKPILKPTVNIVTPSEAELSSAVASPLTSPVKKRASRATKVPEPHQYRNPLTGRIKNKPLGDSYWYATKSEHGVLYDENGDFYNPKRRFNSTRDFSKTCEPCKFRNQLGTKDSPKTGPQCKKVVCPEGLSCNVELNTCIDPSKPLDQQVDLKEQEEQETNFTLSD